MTQPQTELLQAREIDLPNGLHVILHEDHFAPVTAVQVWVGAGSADERPDEAGIAHVLEHMLFKGTPRRGVGEIARQVESAGGDINAWTSMDETVYHIAIPSSETALALDILADAVGSSLIAPEELKAEIEVILEEIRRTKDNPDHILWDESMKTLFERHPYRLPVIGTSESVSGFTSEKVHAFKNRWYVPPHLTLVVAGDFDPDAIRTEIDRTFGRMAPAPTVERPRFDEPPLREDRARILLEDNVHQAHLSLAFHSSAVFSDHLPADDVLSVLLGQGESSRLALSVQREKKLVTDIGAFTLPGRSAGAFLIEAELPPEHLFDAITAISVELRRLATEEVREKELTKVKTLVENEALYQIQTMQGRARRLGMFHTLAGNIQFARTHLHRVLALNPAEIRARAEELFAPGRMSFTLLLPKKRKLLIKDPSPLLQAARKPFDERVIIPDGRSRTIATGQRLHPFTLRNGLRLIVVPNPTLPLVSFQAAMLGGVRYETEKNNGIHSLISALLTEGTKATDAIRLAETIESMAGHIEGFSGRQSLGLKGSVIRRHFDRAFDLFAECLTEPIFPSSEVERERKLQLDEIAAKTESPAKVAFDLFLAALYESHPFRLDVLGVAESVRSLKVKDLRDAYKRLLDPRDLVLVVVGDVEPEPVAALVEHRLSPLKAPKLRHSAPAPEPAPQSVRRRTRRLPTQQHQIVLGFQGLTMDAPQVDALRVLNAALSGQGGRLFLNLRDRQSLAYSVYSTHMEFLEPGLFACSIGCAPAKREAAIQGIWSELEKVREEGLTQEEILSAKRYLVGSHAISLQRNSSVAGSVLFNELYGLGFDAHLKYPERIQSVTPEEILGVARRLLRPDAYVLAEVGPDLPESPDGEHA